MKRLFGYLFPYRFKMLLGLIIKVTGTVMDLFLPVILSHIIDNIIPTKDINRIAMWGGIMVVCSFVALFGNITANRMAARVSGDAIRNIRHDLFKKISYLDAAKVDELTISSLESRITSDTYSVHTMIGMVQRMGVRAPILIIGGFIMAFMLDARLNIMLALTMPLIFITVFFVSKKGVKLYKKLQFAVDDIVNVVRENATGVRVIKALGKTEYEKKRFDKVNTNAVKIEKNAGTVMAMSNPLITFFLNFGLCAVIVTGAYLVDGGLSTNGKIIAFMSYFTIISNATIAVSRIFTMTSKGIACMNRIDAVLSEEPTLWVEKYGEFDGLERENDSHISFKNVSFAYKDKNIIEDISFDIKHGETLGIIGATGCGKSTVISLLMRMYDVNEGEISVDGINIKKIPSSVLREKFGVVFQNDFLFADSIYENVSFGRNLSENQVSDALKTAQAEFVDNYEEKTGYILDIKGANLSGGQKQRLLVARAVAAKPEILILDDSSSALDYKTDMALRTAIASCLSGTTSIIIAQRISSVMNANKIMVMDKGRIIGLGTHDELLRGCDIYREIYDTQMGGGAVLE